MFAAGTNYANVLTRRREAYHDLALERQAASEGHGDGTASIHDIEAGIRLDERPPLDAEDRAFVIERVLPKGVGFHDYARGSYWPVLSWARRGTECTVARRRGGVELACGMDAGHEGLTKRIRFEPDGRIVLTYKWDPAIADPEDLFAPEFSIAGAAEVWSFAPLPRRKSGATLLRPLPSPSAGSIGLARANRSRCGGRFDWAKPSSRFRPPR